MVEDLQKVLLNKIIEYYLNSNDFNGMPISKLNGDYRNEILELLKEDKVEVLSEKFVLNPYIKTFNLDIPFIELEKEILENYNRIILYPSSKVLKEVKLDSKKYFSEDLAKGKPQLEFIYFKVDILENYYSNPRYDINFCGYRGTIGIKENLNNNEEFECINFGMAHKKDNSESRAVAVLLYDLAELTEINQLKWYINKIGNQEDYIVEYDFFKNTILGEWAENYWIYTCLLEEIKIINKMCEKMHLPRMFKKEYEISDNEMRYYKTIFLPTEKNYNDFLLILEKLLINNLDGRTFTSQSDFFIQIENSKNDDGTNKASITLFNEWLKLNVKGNPNIEEDIIKPLKIIRKKRQGPAHDLTPNNYDENIWKEQNDLIKFTYRAIRYIRLLFTNHPSSSQVQVPEYLFLGKNIITY